MKMKKSTMFNLITAGYMLIIIPVIVVLVIGIIQ